MLSIVLILKGVIGDQNRFIKTRNIKYIWSTNRTTTYITHKKNKCPFPY